MLYKYKQKNQRGVERAEIDFVQTSSDGDFKNGSRNNKFCNSLVNWIDIAKQQTALRQNEANISVEK